MRMRRNRGSTSDMSLSTRRPRNVRVFVFLFFFFLFLQGATLELFLLLLKSKHNGRAGKGEEDSAGLCAKDLRNTNKTLALLLLPISQLTSHMASRAGRRMNTRDIFAKHLSHPSKMESKRFRRINTALQSVPLTLYICMYFVLSLSRTHTRFI